MIQFSFIVAVILVLYIRTWKHENIIDDSCERSDYLRRETSEVDALLPNKQAFYDSRRPIRVTVECILTHIANGGVIMLIWGWKAALLYSLSPMVVHTVAWKIGAQIYGSSTLLLLVCHYFVINYGDFGLIFGALLYYSAIQCSLSALPYPLLIPLIRPMPLEGTILYILILLLFISGNRFRSALKRRVKIHENVRIKAGRFNPKRIIIMVKVIACYIQHSLTPPWRIKGGFFVNIKNINSTRLDRHFWVSLLLDILFYSWAWIISPFMALWHLAFILPYSGFILYGMLIAERYQSIFIIATCVLLSRALPHEVFIVLAALWFYRSLLYIKIFRSNETLFRENCYSHSETSEPYVNLASWLMERGRFNAALAYLLMAIKLGEASSHIYADTSLCYQKCGQFTKALYYLELTLKGCPLDKIELVKRQKRHLEDKIRQVEYHKKTLKRRGII